MAALKVLQLEIDEYNEREYGAHRISTAEILQVLNNHPKFFRNTSGHSASHIMIGPTHGNRMLTIPTQERNADTGYWRPATGWDSSDNEEARYWRAP